MLDIRVIREQTDKVKSGLRAKNVSLDIDDLLRQDEEKRVLLQEVEALKCERNKASEEISKLKQAGQDNSARIAEMKAVSHKIAELDKKVGDLDQKISETLLFIPNLPHETVPVGDPSHNKVVAEWGKKPEFSFKPKDHIALGEALGYFSLDQARKISGSGFTLFRGQGARLERGLINFMLDFHTKKHGYTEIAPPYLVTRQTMTGTGQLPKLEADMYKIEGEEHFLIPTAEVPVTNIHRDDILREEDLPVKYAAYSACFRKEAGSYGQDTKGLIRVHQFDKVELVKFVHPDKSYDELESLRANAEAILQALGLHYRVLLLASGDLSFSGAKCYDLEVWAPGTGRWLEVSSCSNFVDFQARRANIRYKPADKDGKKAKAEFVHTLNASGLALPRTVIALLENYQKADGSVEFPEALRPYLS